MFIELSNAHVYVNENKSGSHMDELNLGTQGYDTNGL